MENAKRSSSFVRVLVLVLVLENIADARTNLQPRTTRRLSSFDRLNIAEGNGKPSLKDKHRFFEDRIEYEYEYRDAEYEYEPNAET